MSRETLLDGATIAAVTTMFNRLADVGEMRPINVVALSSLIDCYVLFERLVVPEEHWLPFRKVVPKDWLLHLEPVVRPVKIEFDSSGMEAFLSDPNVFWALQGILHLSKSERIYFDYETYTGGDFGMKPRQRQSWIELERMERLVTQVWKDQYHSANPEHVDPVHAAWRGSQYSQYCASNGLWYVPHELRGRFLDAQALLAGHPHPEPSVDRVFAALREYYARRHKAVKLGISQSLLPRRPRSELLWQQLKVPLVSSRVFQMSADLYGIFDNAFQLRKRAAKFRKECAHVDMLEGENKLEKAEAHYQSVVNLFRNLDGDGLADNGMTWSIGLSYPWGLSISVNPPARVWRHYSFIRDIYACRTLPLTLQSDLERLFQCKPAEWLKKDPE
jgi:hypothetical protein